MPRRTTRIAVMSITPILANYFFEPVVGMRMEFSRSWTATHCVNLRWVLYQVTKFCVSHIELTPSLPDARPANSYLDLSFTSSPFSSSMLAASPAPLLQKPSSCRRSDLQGPRRRRVGQRWLHFTAFRAPLVMQTFVIGLMGSVFTAVNVFAGPLLGGSVHHGYDLALVRVYQPSHRRHHDCVHVALLQAIRSRQGGSPRCVTGRPSRRF